MTEKLFDLSDVSDIPKIVLKELKINDGVSKTDFEILSLFSDSENTLDISQLLVAHYRRDKKIKTRLNITTIVYRLQKKKLLLATGLKKGQYTITSDGLSILKGRKQ